MKYPIPSRVPLPSFRPDAPMVPQQFPPAPMAPPQAQPGLGARFGGFIRNNSDALAAMSQGLLSGQTASEQWAGGMNGLTGSVSERRKKSKTLEWMMKNAPEYAEAVEAGALSLPDAYKMSLEAKKPQKPDFTSDMKEYNLAREQGFDGTFLDYITGLKKAGATNVSVGGDSAPGLGKLSTDYGYELGPDGKPLIDPTTRLPRAAPIPGSPAAREIESGQKQRTVQQSARDISTRTITTAAQRAREAAQNRAFGPYGQGVVGAINPYSDSAEVQRQVDVLKANAKIENLTAMRAASPTGGALGAVSDAENAMLAVKSGALDPSSLTFERDLEDFELTMLQIIHGFEAGTQIYNSTRSGSVPMGQEDSSGIGSLLDKYDPQR